MELAQHLDEGKMGSHIVDDSLGSVLDQELEKLEGLSYLRDVPRGVAVERTL